MNNLIISKESLRRDFYKRLEDGKPVHVSPQQAVTIANAQFGISGVKAPNMALINAMRPLSSRKGITLTGKYKSGFDYRFKGGSINEMIASGKFSSSSTNTLSADWTNFVNAQRFDLTVRQMEHQTIRGNFYREVMMPNATATITPQEMYPYAFRFSEVDGQGQAVPQGTIMGGETDAIAFKIYATGFNYTLLLSLFNQTFDLERMNDGVAVAHAAKKDDLAMSPILDYTYTGTQQTAADTTVSAGAQELLYRTLSNAIDDMGKRSEPSKGEHDKYLVASDLTVLCSTYDSHHIAPLVASGLPSVNQMRLPPLTAITKIVTYDDTTIEFPETTDTYTGVTAGTIYLVKSNNRMMIPIKRALTMEFDPNPSVPTLSKEERAWYIVESIYNTGIASYIQEVTLPAWP